MVHVDVKKLGRIVDGGGHRNLGRIAGQANARSRNLRESAYKTRGCFVAMSSSTTQSMTTPATYTPKIRPDETTETDAAFMRNARSQPWPQRSEDTAGTLTDYGFCYGSHLFAQTLTDAGIRHKRTRPYRSQTNGKT